MRRIRRKVALSGTNRWWDLWVVPLRTLNVHLIVFFPFLLLYRFMQPRGSTPKEGDNVMARLHVTCPGPGNTRYIYSARHEP